MSDYEEKRDYRRMVIDCEFTFTKQGETEQLNGQVINLSSNGILFTTETNFEVGAVLEIILKPSNSLTPPMQATARVARVIDNQAVYELACEFEQIH